MMRSVMFVVFCGDHSRTEIKGDTIKTKVFQDFIYLIELADCEGGRDPLLCICDICLSNMCVQRQQECGC